MNNEVMGMFLFVGMIQALVLLIGININKPLNSTLKKSTTLLLFTVSLVIVYYLVLLTKNELLYPYVDSLGTSAWMAICPSYYLLCKSIVDSKFKLSIKHWLLFPISVLFILEGVVTTVGVKVWVYNLVNDAQLFLDLWMAYFFISGMYFIYKSLLVIKANSSRVKAKEITVFTYAFLGILVVFGFSFLVLREHYHFAFEYILILLLELFVFALIYRIFKFASLNTVIGASSYSNAPASPVELEKEAVKLETIMEEKKPYLNKKLTLNELSNLAETSSNKLSLLFNVHYQSSFYEFINDFRITHVEKLLNEPESVKYTITAIAEMSGFNSKATFYKVFKERYGMSPSEYLKSKGGHSQNE